MFTADKWDEICPNKNAFNAGRKSFFNNSFNTDKFYGEASKEYERGYNAAYFRNIKYRAERNTRK